MQFFFPFFQQQQRFSNSIRHLLPSARNANIPPTTKVPGGEVKVTFIGLLGAYVTLSPSTVQRQLLGVQSGGETVTNIQSI